MKRTLAFLTAFSVLVLAFTACSVTEKQATLPDNIDLAIEEVFADDIIEDIFSESYDILFDASEYGIFKSDAEDEDTVCKIRTVERPEGERWPKVVTIDFGDGCEDRLGNVRKGKIIVTVTGKYKEEGSTRSITFEDYYVNDNKVEGEKVITNTGREDGLLVFSIELTNGKIIRADGAVIERNASKTRTWAEGEETPARWDDVFVINGTVNKVNKNGVNVTKTITDLVRARNCRFPLSGIVEITTDDDRPVAVIDYGEGECDKWATVTVGEGEDAETWIVNLRKRGMLWKKQDGNDGVEPTNDGNSTGSEG
jgi:hypothetical protein